MATLSITLVQSFLEWENPVQNTLHLQQLLKKVESTDLIVLPEMFTTAFSMTAKAESMSGPSINWMLKLASNKNALVIGSLPIRFQKDTFNRLICAFPNGMISHYDKRHLFSLINESNFFKPGKNRLTIEYKGWRICPLICYDLRFPVFSRNTDNYDLLLYVANWPLARISHWKQLLPARAIENQSYVAGVNRVGKDFNEVEFNGQSMLVDPTGKLVYNATNSEEVSTHTLEKNELINIRKKHPFLDDADHFNII